MIIRGEQLPPCRTCKLGITYEVRYTVSHITHDWDFTAPHADPRQYDFASLRRSPRYAVQLPIEVQLGHNSKKVKVPGNTTNLSERGLGAMMGDKLSSKHRNLVIQIGAGRNEQPVLLHARLRYRKGLQHGFEFTRLTPVKKAALRLLLEKQRPQPSLVSG